MTEPPRDDTTHRRRSVLAWSGRTLAGGAAVAAASSPAAASHAGAKPNHVTITNDPDFLRSYRPYLDTSAVPYSNRPTLYGWRASSPERDTEVAVYAAEYAVQSDVFTLSSHAGDHEWVYVFVNGDGGVDHVAYTAYHWLRGYKTRPAVYTDGDGPHPKLRVADRYHHYIPADVDTGVLLDVEPLGDPSDRSGPLYQWLANGMESDLAEGAVHNPWLLSRSGPLDAWWSEDTAAVNIWIVSAWGLIGIRGAEDVDTGQASPGKFGGV